MDTFTTPQQLVEHWEEIRRSQIGSDMYSKGYKHALHKVINDLKGMIETAAIVALEEPSTVTGKSKTSRQAAADTLPRSGTQRRRVFDAIGAGSTDHEICMATALAPSTVRPRRGELVKAGLLEDTGFTRQSPTGNKMTVWAWTELATNLLWDNK